MRVVNAEEVQAHVKIKKLRKWSSQRLITGYL
jgi:intergrase/recombinase